MRITIELRRPSRRGAALLVALMMLAAPAAVLASHNFSDVPDDHPFHNDIAWMADNGITTGFDDGTYRPDQPVSRQAMAAFMHRLSNEIEVVQLASDPSPSNTFLRTVFCPDDKRPIAGGGTTSSGNLFITDSYPSASAWNVQWETDNDATLDPALLTVYVTCAPRL